MGPPYYTTTIYEQCLAHGLLNPDNLRRPNERLFNLDLQARTLGGTNLITPARESCG